jgi:uncharacterized protein
MTSMTQQLTSMTANGAASVHDAGVETMDLVLAELARLRELVSGVQGCVIAGVDGLLVLHDLGNGPEPHDLAALAATTFGVGRQCGLALRHGPFRESTLRSTNGYFTVYAISDTALLAVLGDERLNVARLHLEARLVTAKLAQLTNIKLYEPE